MSTTYTAERFDPSATRLTVDRSRNIVPRVRVAGLRSRNGRKYPERVLRAALALYDNVRVNVGHHRNDVTGLPAEVPPTARFGRLTSPAFETSGIVADLHYNPEHPFAKPFLWAAENDPRAFAFSHLAAVRWLPQPDGDGDQVAESINHVASVDIVTEGGATSGVFESAVWESARWVDPGREKIRRTIEAAGAYPTDDLVTLVAESHDKAAAWDRVLSRAKAESEARAASRASARYSPPAPKTIADIIAERFDPPPAIKAAVSGYGRDRAVEAIVSGYGRDEALERIVAEIGGVR